MKRYWLLSVIGGFIVCSCVDDLYGQSASPAVPDSFLAQLIEAPPRMLQETGLALISFEKRFTVSSRKECEAIIDSLFTDKNFFLPVYNKEVAELDVLTSEELLNSSHLVGSIEEIRKTLASYLDGRLEVGDRVYQLNWELKGEEFSTLALMSPYHIIYDHIIANLVTFSGRSTQTPAREEHTLDLH